ncbi:MAG: hypothetical protein AAB927_01040 [Patescibacteria group bacterium]
MKIILVDAVNTFVIEGRGIFGKMHELLETFPNRKIILTNANDQQAKGYGLDAVPYEVFSLKHNPDKTDPEYFKKMLEHFHFKKDNVIYFEHNNDAVKSAQSVGITAYHYDSGKKDLEALEVFLKTNL